MLYPLLDPREKGYDKDGDINVYRFFLFSSAPKARTAQHRNLSSMSNNSVSIYGSTSPAFRLLLFQFLVACLLFQQFASANPSSERYEVLKTNADIENLEMT